VKLLEVVAKLLRVCYICRTYYTGADMGFLTTQDAAQKLGVTPTRVRALIQSQRLPATKFSGVWMISEKDLVLVQNRKPGAPRKGSRANIKSE